MKSFLEDILKEYRMSDTLLAYTDVFAEYAIDGERRIDIVIQNASIVYLTRFGDTPSEYSRKKKDGTDVLSLDNIQCISWKDDICN